MPVAGAAGAVLPGCECASVPVAGALMTRGVTPTAFFAFLLSAPAIHLIVLISTFVAFPGEPEMVLARLVASFATRGDHQLAVATASGQPGGCASLGEPISRAPRPGTRSG